MNSVSTSTTIHIISTKWFSNHRSKLQNERPESDIFLFKLFLSFDIFVVHSAHPLLYPGGVC